MFRNKDAATAAVVTAAERATAADTVWGTGSQHSAVGRRDLADRIIKARAAGVTDDEIRTAVKVRAFGKH